MASFSADLIQNITDNGWRTGRNGSAQYELQNPAPNLL
jgi:hypothetical protein